MKWYSKYLTVFEKPYDNIPATIIAKIQQNLQKFNATSPVASVVVIAHNEEDRLLACLWSLSENQCDFPVEIIGISNLSTDRTEQIFESTGIKWYKENLPGAGHARQCGLEHAQGKYYLCIDSDTMYPPLYIKTMVNKLKKKEVVGASTLYDYIPDSKHPYLGLKIYQWMRNIHVLATSIKRPEMSVRGAVFGFHRELGQKIGFRTDIKRGEDGSMALALKQFGKITFTLNHRMRAVTSARTLDADGSFFNSFKNRFVKYIKTTGSYFTKKANYQDEDSNLLKN